MLAVRLMAASVMSRRGPRLRYLPGLRRDFTKAQRVPVQQKNETDDQERNKGVLQHQESSPQGEYRLYYNRSSYHRSVSHSATSRRQTANDEKEKDLSTLAPSFGQQSNHSNVSSSQPLSSSKNTFLDLAFNECPEPEMPSASQRHSEPTQPDVGKVRPSFRRYRPEYDSMTRNRRQRHTIKWEEALGLLQDVALLGERMKPSDVSQFLVELSSLQKDYLSLLQSEQGFTMLLEYSVKTLRLFDETQLLQSLQSFVWLHMPLEHNIFRLYEAELNRRASQMSLHQLLFAADLWLCIWEQKQVPHDQQVPQFLQHVYDSVSLHLKQIGAPELVQLLYIIGESRHCPKHLFPSIEWLLMLHLHQLYPDEVGAVCLGLFKSKISISEHAATCIVDKAHSFVEEMSNFALVNVMKHIRFNYIYHKMWLQALAQEVPRRANMGVMGLMHVALACSSLHHKNDKILMTIAEKFPSMEPHCRLKDASKLLWAFGTLRFLPHQSPSFYPSLKRALRSKKDEFQQYPEHLLTALLGLAYVSQLPKDLSELTLSPEFVNIAWNFPQHDLKKDLFTLDETVARELPEWRVPRLSRELREEVTDTLWRLAQSDVCLKPDVLEAESHLQDLLGGEQFVCKRMILPHTRSIDLEVHLDSNKQPIPLSPENLSSKCPSDQGWGGMNVGVNLTEDLLAQLIHTKNTRESLTPSPTVKPMSLHGVEPDKGVRRFDTELDLDSDFIETPTKPRSQGSGPRNSEGTVKLAIQVPSRNHYCLPSQELMGLHVLKRRQLKLAGYRLVILEPWEWFPLLKKSKDAKLAYLHSKVKSSQQ
ncbi:FAST kinase domain-containing protein 5, mitochondrial isoform X2 [Centropristis striata]|uniref:FAST kinase domain-containing protein 5, mitochondrial isoform X2 n=1 Tax=Centropristis striata TaxID=184440 RepID=UPI0027DF31A3|nr:FAST kinase domain-containing protein 5, mitochondrial isoform X2 [Centropristis striata]